MPPVALAEVARDLRDAADLARSLAAILKDLQRADLDLARQMAADIEAELRTASRRIEEQALGLERLHRIPPPGASLP